MSILTWLKGVLSLFINNFPAFVEKLFKKIPDELKEQLSLIITVVNGVKKFVDSPLADVLTAIIPTQLDDNVKDWLRLRLPDVLEKLNLVNDGIISLSEDKAVRGAQLRSISSVLTSELTGMPEDQAAITSQVVYKNS